jgi:hypothetical protein
VTESRQAGAISSLDHLVAITRAQRAVWVQPVDEQQFLFLEALHGHILRVVLEAPGGFAMPVPAGWKLKKVIGKGKGQPAASILVRLAAE